MEQDRHDAILMEVLREKRTVLGFMEAVFGFLSRKTDFYHTMKNDTDTLGFPAGYKEHLVLKVIQHFEPPVVNSSNGAPRNPIETLDKESSCSPTHMMVAADIEIDSSKETFARIPDAEFRVTPELPQRSSRPLIKRAPAKNNVKKQFQSNEHYNGAIFSTYCWSQTVSELEIHIQLPSYVTSSKHLQINIETDHIKVKETIHNEVLLEGKMVKKCKPSDSVWSITGGKLQLTLDKIQETWWNKFLITEPEIDLTKMDCSRSMDELPEDQQAAIEKLKWDQQQKMLGLPTSEEIKNHEMLRNAWDVEGSPFKGQPFDPSLVKFN